jgi:hypothetical protein
MVAMTSSLFSQWESLLLQREQICSRIDQRLEAVAKELKELDALRQSLTTMATSSCAEAPIRRTVIFPSSPSSASSSSRKRRCDDGTKEHSGTVAVGFLKVRGARRHASAIGRVADPFEDAGLFAEEGNPIAQFAPVQWSSDEVTHQQIRSLFPLSTTPGVHKTASLPPTAISRIESAVDAAGLSSKAFSFGRRAASEAYLRVAMQSFSDVRGEIRHLLSSVQTSPSLRMLRTTLCSDPTAVGSRVLAAVAEQAAAAAHTHTSSPHFSAVQLLALQPLQRSTACSVAWTFAQCCQCTDRDVMESTHVQWAHVLCNARPTMTPPSLLQDTVLYAALCYALLQKLVAASAVRQGYLGYVLTAYGGYPHVVDVHALTSRRPAETFFAHVSEVFEDDVMLFR